MTPGGGDGLGLRVGYVLGTTAGGTRRHVVMLAGGLAGGGAQVCAFGPGELAGLFGEPAVTFGAVAIADRPAPWRDLRAVLRLRRLLRSRSLDVVHAHGLRAGALTALALRPLGGLPSRGAAALVVTVHNAPPGAARLAAVYALLERIVAKRADAVLCVSPDLMARMRELGAADVGRAVVPAPALAPVPGAVGAEVAAGGRPVVFCAARLAPQKGLDVLLHAAATADWRSRRPVPQLVIAGDGPLAGELADLAGALQVDARFLGNRDDVPGLLATADVFVLPSRWEGQPLILQEALRAGGPIVATDVGGVRDLTGADAALLVSADDPDALSKAVLAVLDDAELARRLGAAAARRASELPGEADAVTAAATLYRRIVSRP